MSNNSWDMPKTNVFDVAAMVARGGFGAVPVVGAALAEIVTVLIPQQRSARVEAYIGDLAQRLEGVIADANLRELSDMTKIDLFEEGAFQAARAITDQRREYIVSVVARGLNGDVLAAANAKTVLHIMKELDERQIIILAGYLPQHNFGSEYFLNHADVLDVSEPVTLGSPQDIINKNAYHEYSTKKLVSIGLLNESFRTGDYKLPKLDHNGRPEVSSRNLTRLGALILDHFGFDVSIESYW